MNHFTYTIKKNLHTRTSGCHLYRFCLRFDTQVQTVCLKPIGGHLVQSYVTRGQRLKWILGENGVICELN